jgi:hypothetical protein
MKCFNREQLFSYASHLLEAREEEEIRAHLEECTGCRKVLAEYERLDAALEQWKPTEPSPWFDARLRHAMAEQDSNRSAKAFWGLGWARALALASLIAVVVGLLFVDHAQRSRVQQQMARQAPAAQKAPPEQPREMARTTPSPEVPHPTTQKPAVQSAQVSSGEVASSDRDALSLDDYDMVANFEALSELPIGNKRIEN